MVVKGPAEVVVESACKAMIQGRLIVDVYPDGTVSLVFLADTGGGDEYPVRVQDLSAAEILFMMCGVRADRAAALREEVKRNKFASVNTSVDKEIAAKFRYAGNYN